MTLSHCTCLSHCLDCLQRLLAVLCCTATITALVGLRGIFHCVHREELGGNQRLIAIGFE